MTNDESNFDTDPHCTAGEIPDPEPTEPAQTGVPACEESRILVIYHKNCFDGIAAAWIAQQALGEENVELYAMSYNDEPCLHYFEGRCVLVVDFSFDELTTREIAVVAAQVTIIDHHKTSYEVFKNLEMNQPANLRMFHDGRFCGATSTARHFSMPEPWWLSYVNDYDMWHFRERGSKEVALWMRAQGCSLDTIDALNAFKNADAVIELGKPIVAYHNQIVAQTCESAIPIVAEGVQVPAVINFAGLTTSFIGDTLRVNAPFAVIFHARSDGTWGASLRSCAEGLDVSMIAKKYGGGGHRNAAGCEAPVEWLSQLFPVAPAGD